MRSSTFAGMNSIKSWIVLGCSAAMLGFPTGTKGQVMDSVQHNLQSVIITGNKLNGPSGSGQYITRQTLEKLNQVNVNHVLRIIPGVNVRDEEGFGLRPNIGLRGTAVNRSAKITLMEDGVLIAPATYADPAAYYFPTFARMQGVEVLKGSSQIKYGPYTVGGAVNLISRQIPNRLAGQALLSYGSFGTTQQHVWVGNSHENIDYVFDVNRVASNGFKQLDNQGPTGFDRRDVMGKLRWHTQAHARVQQSLTLKMVSMREVGHESYLGLTYNDYQQNRNRRYAATQRDQLNMSHQHIALTHQLQPFRGAQITTTVYNSNTARNWVRVNTVDGQGVMTVLNNPDSFKNAYNIMRGLSNGNVDLQGADRMYDATGVQSQFQYAFKTHHVQHELQVGARLHADAANRYATRIGYSMNQGTLIQTASGIIGNQENQIRKANALAGFATYSLQYKQWKVSPGIRVESIRMYFNNYGTADNARVGTNLLRAQNSLFEVLPGMSVSYEINRNANAFAGVHKGFSPPGMPVVNTLGEQARSELSTNYELGYRYQKNAAQLQAVAFLTNYRNILGSDNVSGGGMGTGNMFNAGNARIGGLELMAQIDLVKSTSKQPYKLPVGLSYTYTHARFLEDFINAGGDWGNGNIIKNDVVPFITPHMLSFNLGYERTRWNVTASGRYTGITRVKPSHGNYILPSSTQVLNNINALPAFFILDVSANYKLSQTFTLFTQCGNVTNSKAIVANLPQGYRSNMPFSVLFGIKAQW